MATIRKREWTTAKGELKTAWQVDYRDSAGKRRSKQFERKKDADAWSTKARYDVSQGTHTPDSQSITVRDAGKLYLDRARREKLEPFTIKGYETFLRLHIYPWLGDHKLSQLTTPLIGDFRDWLLENVSRTMTAKVMTCLSGVIKTAMLKGLVAQNVVAGVQVRRSGRDKPEILIPTKAEMKAIIGAAGDEHAHKIDRALFVTAIFTGMRSSELRGLAWGCVDLKAATIKVEQRVDRYGTLGPPKSKAGFRTIPLASIVVSELRKWKLQCPKGKHDLVFPNGQGNPESNANLLNRHLWPIQVRAGVSVPMLGADGQPSNNDEGTPTMDAKYSMHALRHAAASLWIEQGVQPKKIQTWMGHASIKMTFDTYGHLFAQREADAAVMAAVENEVMGA